MKRHWRRRTINPPFQIGLYFLIHNKKVVYIGQSRNLYNRAFSHQYTKEHDTIRFMSCPLDRLTYYETRWIGRFKPIYNKAALFLWDYINLKVGQKLEFRRLKPCGLEVARLKKNRFTKHLTLTTKWSSSAKCWIITRTA